MDPYEANPDKILPDDRYADVPFYGRYYPRPVDFRPNPKYLGSGSDASLKYWESVLVLCSESTRIYEDTEGGRDVFALGSVIVKSSHLHVGVQGRRLTRDYSYADENEVKATELARGLLGDVMVPAIYFAGKVISRIAVFPCSVLYLVSSRAKCHIRTTGQRPRRACAGAHSRRWPEHCLAIHLESPKAGFQAASTRDSFPVTRCQAFFVRQGTAGPQLHRRGPGSSQPSGHPGTRARHHLLGREP